MQTESLSFEQLCELFNYTPGSADMLAVHPDHQGQGLAGWQREADAIHGAHGPGRRPQFHLQVVDPEEWRRSVHFQSVHRDEGCLKADSSRNRRNREKRCCAGGISG